jgi:hypothetical protein
VKNETDKRKKERLEIHKKRIAQESDTSKKDHRKRKKGNKK